MLVLVNSVLAKGVDPGVKPSLDAPWIKNFLQTFAGQIVGTAIICFVIVAVLGLIVWGFSKATGMSQGSEKGLGAFVAALVGALLVGSVGGAIAWASGWNLFG